MQTARRLYVYLVSAVALGFVLFGLRSLLEVLLDTIGLRDVVAGRADASQQLSVALALVGVGTPVWLLHWWYAERSVRPDRDGSAAERQSTVRALYFAGLLGVLLIVGAAAASELVTSLLSDALRTEDYYGGGPGDSIPTIVVVGAAWAYHAVLRRRDMAVAVLTGPAVWLSRTYLYAAAFGGALVTMVALIPLLESLVQQAFDQPVDAFVWVGAVGPALAGILVWIGHRWYTERLLRDGGWRGASERTARLRLAYLVSLIVVGVGWTVALVSQGVQPLVVRALGSGPSEPSLAAAVLGPLLAAVPFAFLGWWFHVRALRREANAEADADRPALVWQLERVAVALTGLTFAAVGSARLIAIVLNAVLASDAMVIRGGMAVSDLGMYLPFAVLGGAVWLWAWIALERRRVADPVTEARSPIRRAALLIVLAASVIAGLASLALILYRLFGFLLGAGLTGDAASELSTPTGILVVAVVGGVYHGLALRRDQSLAEAQPVEAEGPSASAEPGAPREGGRAPTPSVRLTLVGPAGEDAHAALEALRAALPEGYRLEGD